MEKMTYTEPSLEIMPFEITDVILTSGGDTELEEIEEW